MINAVYNSGPKAHSQIKALFEWMLTKLPLLLLIPLGLTLLAGCNKGMDAKFNATTQEEYTESLRTIKSQLSDEENRELEKALKSVLFSDFNVEGGLLQVMAQLSDAKGMSANFLSKVHGKTPREIIASAKKIEKAQKEKELESIISEINELEAKQVAYNLSKLTLTKIIVKDPKFYWSKNTILREPVIDIKVKNEAGIPLSRLYFHGTISTPGRAIPWVDEDFNYEISGGLENGEKKHLKLSPNMFSKWGNSEVKKRMDTVFTVQVVNAEDAKGNPLADPFTSGNEERLSKLYEMQKKYREN